MREHDEGCMAGGREGMEGWRDEGGREGGRREGRREGGSKGMMGRERTLGGMGRGGRGGREHGEGGRKR